MSSRTDDSEGVISELRREINDLKKEARNQSLVRERVRRRITHSTLKSPRPSPFLSSCTEVQTEKPSPLPTTSCSVPKSKSQRASEERVKDRNTKSLGRHQERSPWHQDVSIKKSARNGEQGDVWKALDLVASSPFSKEIKRAELPERFTTPRFDAYDGRTNPVAHISHYQQRMTFCRYNSMLMCRLFPFSLGKVALQWFN